MERAFAGRGRAYRVLDDVGAHTLQRPRPMPKPTKTRPSPRPRAPRSLLLGKALARARMGAGHENASAFARAMSLAPNTVYRIEAGKICPGADTLMAWALACHVSLDTMVRGVPVERGAAA